MKEMGRKLAVNAGAAALALLMTAPAFAQSRGDWNRDGSRDDRSRAQSSRRSDDRRDSRDTRSSSSRTNRENERITMNGRISELSRDRDGYRVRLDRDNRWYYVPQSYFRGHNNVRVGLSVRLGAIFRGGMIYVDAVNWPGYDDRYDGRYDGAYGASSVRGIVERIDYRDEMILLRDDRSRRTVEIDMRDADRYGRLDLNDIRRGDFIEVSGQWYRDGFVADRIDDVRSR